MTRVLIVGIPRSGTSWVEKTLASAPGAVSVHEPDNEDLHALALRAKHELGRFPVLHPGDSAPLYEQLWRRALSGGTPRPPSVRDAATKRIFPLRHSDIEPDLFSTARARFAALLAPTTPRRDNPRNVVVKSVHCALALVWIYEAFHPRVVIVLRHPFAIIASQIRMGMKDRDVRLHEHPSILSHFIDRKGLVPPAGTASPAERVAWQVGLLMSALLETASEHPDWQILMHEDVCSAPIERFRDLYSRLAMEWTQSAEEFVLGSDRPGAGYATQRVAAMEIDRWRRSLGNEERRSAERVLSAFPLITSRFEGGWGH